MIVAPKEVIHTWEEESVRLLAAARRDGLPSTVVEVLNHAASIFMAAAINATPGAPELFRAGLRRLVDEVVAEQKAGGVPGAVCPVLESDGTEYVCNCGPAGQQVCAKGQRVCSDAAFDAGTGELDLGGRAS